MINWTELAFAGLALLVLPACQRQDGGAPETGSETLVELWRLDCGTFHVGTLNVFSDTQAYTGRTMELTDSCYLIRHGDEYMLWDAGLPLEALGEELDRSSENMEAALSVTLEAQLAGIGLTPDRIGRVGISHYHFDHIGQLPALPHTTLLIGSGDWEIVTGDDAPEFLEPAFAPWISGPGDVEPVEGDYDVFDDGSVVMLSTPGHTPGHYSLLVRLAADDRATVVIQHEPGDIDKLPIFPASAR